MLCRIVTALGASMLVGCAPIHLGTVAGEQQAVYQAESDFLAALTVAQAYEALPACGGGVVVCADPGTEAKIKASAALAATALKTAEDAARAGSSVAQISAALSDAQADITAFQTLTATLRTK